MLNGRAMNGIIKGNHTLFPGFPQVLPGIHNVLKGMVYMEANMIMNSRNMFNLSALATVMQGNIPEIVSLLGTIIIIIALCAFAITVFIGGKRTVARSFTLLIANIIAGVLALVLTPTLSKIVTKPVSGIILSNLPEDFATNEVLSSFLTVFVAALGSIALFSIFYLIFYLILMIIGKISTHKSEKRIPILSVIISAVSCLFTLYLLISPLYGLAYSAASDASVVLNSRGSNPYVNVVKDALVEDYTDNLSPDRLAEVGAKRKPANSFVYDIITSYKYKSTVANVHMTFHEIFDFVGFTIINIPKDLDPTSLKLDSETIAFVKKAKNKLFESKVLKTLTIECIHEACTAWYNDELYMGMEAPTKGTDEELQGKLLYFALMDASEEQIDEAFDQAYELLKLQEGLLLY